VYKTRITDLHLSTMPLTNGGCRNDGMMQLSSLRFQSLVQLVQISDEYFEHLVLKYSSHSVILETTVMAIYILEFLSLTTQW